MLGFPGNGLALMAGRVRKAAESGSGPTATELNRRLLEAKVRKEEAHCKVAEMELGERCGELVNRTTVFKEVGAIGASLRREMGQLELDMAVVWTNMKERPDVAYEELMAVYRLGVRRIFEEAFNGVA